jgi:hypothetical protein
MVRSHIVSTNIPKKVVIWVSLLFVFLSFYDSLLDLSLWLLHSIAVLLHAMFEFSEHALDLIIEHIFHTDPRTTEIIVFYLMLSVGVGAAIKLIKVVKIECDRVIEQQINYWHEEKTKAFDFWQQQSFIEKLKLASILMTISSLVFLWLFS